MQRRKFLLAVLAGLGSVALLKGLRQWGNQPPDRTSSTSTNPAIASPLSPKVMHPILRFVAIADTGTGYDDQYAVAEAMTRYYRQHPFQLVVLAGDNIYTNGEIWKVASVFEKPYKALLKAGVKFRACLGNHDIRTENGNPQLHYAGFNMGGRYYTFREQNVQFFALDTNGNADWEQQLTWLETELRRSKATWKIVFGHHPIYSSGVYGNSTTLIDRLSPLFKKYGVQLYINGHEHSYERTRPINGTTYLVTGIGGAQLRPVGRSEWTAYATSQYGFTALEVYPDRIEIQGIGTQNQVFDRGQIAKTA